MTDLPSTVCVLQYADDLIISSETREDCEKASIIVCNVLAQAGFKASKEKLQWVQPKVTYLGHIIMPGLRAISTDRVQMIRKMKSPQTVQQLQSFLGLVNYCRSWIPDCAIHDKYLRSLIDRKAPPKTLLNWTDEAEMHFAALKKAITTAPSLGLPSFEREFHLHVRETEGVAMGVLLQQHGSTYRPVAYLSKKLDNVAAGMPACLRAVSAAAIVVQMAEKIVLSHPMIVYTSHQVGAILHNMQTQHMTAQRRSGYEAILLATKNLTIQPTSSINPALLGVLGMADMIDGEMINGQAPVRVSTLACLLPSQQCHGAGHRAAAPPVQAPTKTSCKRKSKRRAGVCGTDQPRTSRTFLSHQCVAVGG
ncbi:endogenous retrovirus group K member 11 Pol [Labeo rohita]|uniref:ribonuclease H n=1 Tax=Labeo rohita TaxID=84645 RepID=A0A498NAV7_LABRO|nr:endogenous retrovirus group K member 11 Pol [Labeo rohita]